MPYLLQSPEDAYRQTRGQFLQFEVPNPPYGPKAEQIYKAAAKRANERLKLWEEWLSQHAPECSMQTLGPSEYSGYIEGGPSTVALFGPASAHALFASEWLTANGACKDGLLDPVESGFIAWEARMAAHSVKPAPLPGPCSARWFDTPHGFWTVTRSAP